MKLSRFTLCLLSLLIAATASAQTVKWIADAPGSWATGANWDKGSPPASTDDVIFDGAHVGDATVPFNFNPSQTINSLTLQIGYSGNISMAANSALVITSTLTISGGTMDATAVATPGFAIGGFIQTGGTFIAPSGTLALRGNWLHTAGTFTHNSGTLEINDDNQHTIDCGGAHFNNFRFTTNAGKITLLNTDFVADGTFVLTSTGAGNRFNPNLRSVTVSKMLTINGGSMSTAGNSSFPGGATIGGNGSTGGGLSCTGIVPIKSLTVLGPDSPGQGNGSASGSFVISEDLTVAKDGYLSASAEFIANTGTQYINVNFGNQFSISHSGAGTLAVINYPINVSTLDNSNGTFVVNAPATVTVDNLTIRQPAVGGSIVDAGSSLIKPRNVNMTGGILRSNADGAISFENAGTTITGSVSANGFQPLIQGNWRITNTQTFSINSNAEMRVESNIANFSGNIAGFTKSGVGKLRLLGTNSYTNTTTVNGGTLYIDGNNGPSNVIVNTGSTLRGTGTIAALTVNTGGFLKPGDSAPGVLTVAGNVVMQSNSTFMPEIFGVGNNGMLKVNGTVTLNSPILSANTTGLTAPFGSSFTLIDNDQADAITGTFANSAQGATVTVDGKKFTVNYTGGTGNDFVVSNLDSPPVIDTAAKATPSSGSFNQNITFSATAHDPDGLPLTYAWNFADGTPDGTTASVQHKFAAAGTYIVVLTVSDGTQTATSQVSITLTNLPPVRDSQPTATPNPVSFTQPVKFAVTAHDPDNVPLAYTWNFGDNTPNGSGAGTDHQYAAAGTYNVVLTISDGVNSITSNLTVTVINLAPIIDAQGTALPNPGSFIQPVGFTAVAHDPEGFPVTYSWDFGDNTPPATGPDVQHTYNAAGSFTATLTVSDGEKTATKTIPVVLLDFFPVIDAVAAVAPNPSNVTQTLSFSASAHDPDGLPINYTWDFGDASPVQNGASVSHKFSAPGSYTVKVTMSDGVKMVTSTVNAIVNPAPPVFDSAPAATPNPAGVSQTITFSAPSHGFGDSLVVTWNFGDGTSTTGDTVTHSYLAPGMYPVIVTLYDGVNMSAASLFVTVNPTRIGFGIDTDGDGFSDATEIATGSSVTDPNSNVLGKPIDPASVQRLSLSKTQIDLNFSKTASDKIALSGSLTIPQGFTPANAMLLIDVGGISKALILNSKGQAKSGNDSFKLSIVKSRQQNAASAKFTASFSKGIFAETLGATSGLINADIPFDQRTVMITIAFGGSVQQINEAVKYKAKLNRTGSARN